MLPPLRGFPPAVFPVCRMSDRLSNDLASLRIDRAAPDPEGGRGPLRAILGVVALCVLLAVGYVLVEPRLEAQFFKTEVDIGEIALVSPAQASIELSSTGYVVPQTVTLVGAKIPGRVAKVNVREGDTVKAGDVLMVLDSADFEAQRRAAQSRIATARAGVASARATQAETQVQLDRETRLVAEGISPKANVENLTARGKALEEGVKAAEAQVAAAIAEEKTTEVNLGYLTIKSPIDGRIVSKPPQLGELVGALTLTPLTIEVADMSTLMVESDVPEARLEMIKPRAPCEIVLDAFPSRRFRGEVFEVSPKVNRQKATVKVKVRFVDSMEGVLPEMGARVSFLTRELDSQAIKAQPKLVVPKAALVERNGQKLVFVVEGDRARMTPVQVGAPFGDGFELIQGPGAGTRIVKMPPETLADGQKIKERTQG